MTLPGGAGLLLQGPAVLFEAVQIAQTLILSAVVIALGLPVVRALSKRFIERPATTALPPDVTARLERIEQAVDAVAVEVERIAEAQRFSARLLSEQSSARPLPRNASEPH